MKSLRMLSISLLLMLLAACAASSQTTYNFTVVDSAGDPVAGAVAQVEVDLQSYASTRTDEAGLASVSVESFRVGQWAKVIIEHEEFQRYNELFYLGDEADLGTMTLLAPDESPVTAAEGVPVDVTGDSDTPAVEESPAETETVDTVDAAPVTMDVSELPEDGALAEVAPADRADYYSAPPPEIIEAGQAYQATIRTDKGDIVVALDSEAAPLHVNNFVFLSRQGFFDGLTFHRVEPGFVIQGGDPLASGQGGPGYTIPGEFELTHEEGVIAMARLPDQVNPNRESSGSQFYITLAPVPQLDGQYSVFGEVIEGMDVVQSIEIGDVIEAVDIETVEE